MDEESEFCDDALPTVLWNEIPPQDRYHRTALAEVRELKFYLLVTNLKFY